MLGREMVLTGIGQPQGTESWLWIRESYDARLGGRPVLRSTVSKFLILDGPSNVVRFKLFQTHTRIQSSLFKFLLLPSFDAPAEAA
jgi:hypothetical protein